MAYRFPAYLPNSKIDDNLIRYKWDDWDVEQAEEPVSDKLYGKLTDISFRANVAFAIGVAEWVVYRYRLVFDDPLPCQYLTAAWAQVIDWNYGCYPWEDYIDQFSSSHEWSGPVKGPINRAMSLVRFSITQAQEYGNPSLPAAWISNLARYVMNEPSPYRRWRRDILRKFTGLYPFDEEEPLGEVIPREEMAPDAEITEADIPWLVNSYLSSIRPTIGENPFLRPPDEMRKEGFVGDPYAFDLAKDHEMRFEW
jgi:hypothetical protein